MARRARDPRPRRNLRRNPDGTLYDVDERRAVSLSELADEVRSGRRFTALEHGSDRDCTQTVLLAVLGSALPGGGARAALSNGHVPGFAGAVSAIAGALRQRADDEQGYGDARPRRAAGPRRGRQPRSGLDGPDTLDAASSADSPDRLDTASSADSPDTLDLGDES